MGMKTNSGFFKGTNGDFAIGDITFMGPKQQFLKYIANRKNKDAHGLFDVIAHGDETYIQIDQGDKTYNINWRVTSKIIKNSKEYKGQGIRLLSCNTGKLDDGFAQNLANKLNVPVEAPISYLAVNPNGKYYVVNKVSTASYIRIRNGFKTFYPKKGK